MPIPLKERREFLQGKKIPADKADELHLSKRQKIKHAVLEKTEDYTPPNKCNKQ